jgi:hypothetical protein
MTDKQSAHNDGQADAPDPNKYEPPHSFISVTWIAITGSEDDLKQAQAENEAYDAGWNNGSK